MFLSIYSLLIIFLLINQSYFVMISMNNKNKLFYYNTMTAFFTITCLLIYTIHSYYQCPKNSVIVPGITSGLIIFPYNDLNQGTVNQNYIQNLGSQASLSKNKASSIGFSIISFEGFGKQYYYSLYIKYGYLDNQNTRLNIVLDLGSSFNNAYISLWSEARILYLIVQQNMQSNGFSYVWIQTIELDMELPIERGVVQGDLFNHQNKKGKCGFDGKYWNTDGCKKIDSVPLYHVYISGFKFNPRENDGYYQLAFSAQLINKIGIFNYQSQQSLQVIFGQFLEAGPKMRIDNFKKQLQKIKISLVMSIMQKNYPSYPSGTFQITYSSIYLHKSIIQNGYIKIEKIVQSNDSKNNQNKYFYDLPGKKYFIYGISRFVALKGLPRQTSIRLYSEVDNKDLLFFQHNFRNPQNYIIFSGDFYYKKLDNICANNKQEVDLNFVNKYSFQHISNQFADYQINRLRSGDFEDSVNQIAFQYKYKPQKNVKKQYISFLSFNISNPKIGQSYEFQLSFNQINKDGLLDYQLQYFTVYINQQEFESLSLLGRPDLYDSKLTVKKAINIYNSTINIRIKSKIYTQINKFTTFRINLLVKRFLFVFNPLTECCQEVCPPASGINISSTPQSCIICEDANKLVFNRKINKCTCKIGYYNYYLPQKFSSICLPCQASLCNICQQKDTTRCVECIFGADLVAQTRRCVCNSTLFQRKDNKCIFTNQTLLPKICLTYGICDLDLLTQLKIYQPLPVKAPKCERGEYHDGKGKCAKCNPLCLTCNSSISCLSCDTSKFRILKNNVCVCRSGYFQMALQNLTRICKACSPVCLTCDISPQLCLTCDSNKFRQLVPLYPSQSNSPANSFFTCQCKSEYYPNEVGGCIQTNCKRDPFCLTCLVYNTTNICTSCKKQLKRYLKIPEYTCRCMKGFWQNSKKQCQRCPDGCVQCLNADKCLNCAVSAKMINDTSCQCKLGTFYKFDNENNVGYCKQCFQKCQICKKQNTCQICSFSFIVNKNKTKCICPSNYYKRIIYENQTTIQNISNQICIKCPEGCLECQNLTYCSKCLKSFLKQQNLCVPNCQMGYYHQKSSNLSILQSKILNQSIDQNISHQQCFKCGQGCVNCLHSQICKQCRPGLILYFSKCYQVCPQGTILLQAMFICIPCNSPCRTCISHPSHCTSCQIGKGYLQVQQGQVRKCSQQCSRGTFSTTSISGNQRICQICSFNCVNCLGNSQNCIECSQNQYLYKGKCFSQCPGILYQNQCLSQCPQGYYLQEIPFNQGDRNRNICMKCSQNCMRCSFDAQNCTECRKELFLRDNSCVKKCQQNQFEYQRICFKCSQKCKSCSKNQYNCISCQRNLTLIENKCLLVCGQNTYYEPLNQSCVKCSIHCKKCNNSLTCLQCQVGLIQNQKGLCTKLDQNKLLIDQDIKKQTNQQQITGLSKEFIINKTTPQCQLGYIYSDGQCNKVCYEQNQFYIDHPTVGQICTNDGCPTGYISNPQNICIKIENYVIPTDKNVKSQIKQQIMFMGSYQNFCLQNQFYYENQNRCVAKCPIGYYGQFSSSVCRKCDQACLICQNSVKCVICKDGYVKSSIDKDVCIKINCSLDEFYFQQKCYTECPRGTFVSQKRICNKICPQQKYYLKTYCYDQCSIEAPFKQQYQCVSNCSQNYRLEQKRCMKIK